MSKDLKISCVFYITLLLTLCAPTTASSQDEKINKCYSYFEKILEIQDIRKQFQDGMNVILDLYNEGKVTQKEVDIVIPMWHTVESKLRKDVTNLYDVAYAENCFEKQLGETYKKQKKEGSK